VRLAWAARGLAGGAVLNFVFCFFVAFWVAHRLAGSWHGMRDNLSLNN
jgi:hypothetical protein